MKVTAVVIDLPRPDAFGHRRLPRSMISVGGEPVVRRVLRTLYGCLCVTRIYALGEPEPLSRANFGATIVPVEPGGLTVTLERIARDSRESGVLLVGPDLGLLKGHHVNAFLDASELSGADVTFGIVDAHEMRCHYAAHHRYPLDWPGVTVHLASLTYLRAERLASRAERVERILGTEDALVWFGGNRSATEERLGQMLHARVSAIHTFPEAALGIDGPGDSDFLNAVLRARHAIR